MPTSANVFLLTAATALVGLGVTAITANLLAGSVMIVLGIVCFVAYEKTPASK